MSTSKGNNCRKRPQKHQNKTAFKNDLHDTSNRTKLLNSLEISGVCKRCKDIIQWKIKYKKYKPLNAPAKCVNCGEKAIRHAYHVLCKKCSMEKKVCAKCCRPVEDSLDERHTNKECNQDEELQSLLKGLPERKRRTVLRFMNRQGDQKVTPEVRTFVEEVMAGVNKICFEDEFDLSNDDFEDSDEVK